MKRLLVVLAVMGALFLTATSQAATATPPTGFTALALDSKIVLAWQPVAGASGYVVLTGSSGGSVTSSVTPPGGVTATSFTDTTAPNGSTRYYVVHSVVNGVESPDSVVVSATASNATCSTGTPVVRENCFPGSTGWKQQGTGQISAGGIEGFLTASSIQKNGSVDVKVNSTAGAPYRIEIWRSGYYGGAGGRLISTINNLTAVSQPTCPRDGTTGLLSCSNWSVSATITTTSAWTSGVYLLRLVREDTGFDNQLLLVVRDDSGASNLMYGVDVATYQAYNNYGGKSLYDFNSTGANTIAGTPRAVKVSFDRPYQQTTTGLRDWYTRVEYPTVYWLERMGYDVSYIANTDLETSPGMVLGHRAYISGAHDEYYSAAMRGALKSARDAGVSLLFAGSNAVYWKIRFEADPSTGQAGRVEVCYKTTQSGQADPVSPTGTWRDPAGANQPENALIGQMYVGDNDTSNFPLVVSAVQGADRVYRYSGLDSQAPGTSSSFPGLVGWEWDARVANGAEPAGVVTLASSPVTGNILQGNGSGTTPGSTSSSITKYTASSGALVFATGTNYWSRGLAVDGAGNGNVDLQIQQVTTNVLADMGALPDTPASNIVLDSSAARPDAPANLAATLSGSTSVSLNWSPVNGVDGYNVYRTLGPRDSGLPLGAKVNATLLSGTSFSDTGLTAGTDYYYVATAVAGGHESAASNEQHVATPTGTPTVVSTTPTDGATAVAVSAPITAQFSVRIDPTTLTSSSFTLQSATGATVAATITYDGTTQTAKLTPTTGLANSTSYLATVATSVRSISGEPLAAPVNWSFVTVAPSPPPTVASTTPASGATGVARDAVITATFSRSMDPATITASSFRVTENGTPVAGTVAYDAASLTATFLPTATLDAGSTYAGSLAASITAADGTPLGTPVTWSFSTSQSLCPCSLMGNGATPAQTNVSTRDGRPLPGPWSYEQGVKITVDVPMTLTDIRFFKGSQETGTHVGRVWTATGTQLASATFTNETASGWQRQALSTPLTLQPDTVYIVSVNLNNVFSVTQSGLAAAIDNGPLHSVADGADGVYGSSAGVFPTQSYKNSNYFVDVVVRSDTLSPPTVTAETPGPDSTGVAANTKVSATFSRKMLASSITASSFTLMAPDGSAVTATVAYDGTTKTATLTPAARLADNTTYTARLDPSVKASDGTALAASVSWGFTTARLQSPPTVTTTKPADGATSVARDVTVTATFSRDMAAGSISGSTFSLTPQGGTPIAANVSYDSTTLTAKLDPVSPLSAATTYTATVTGSVTTADGTPLGSSKTWSFTTSSSPCPCSLFPSGTVPATTNISTRDGRPLPGPWSYEMGVKFTVDQPMMLSAIQYYRAPLETGSHAGRLWTAAGTQLATVAFVNETASGWQKQRLATPVSLVPGVVYVVSVNMNVDYSVTQNGLLNSIVNGPLHSVAGPANGVFGSAAGVFPGQSYRSSNYFVDVTVSDPS